MRALRRTIEIGLPILGTAIVLLSVLLLVELRAQLVGVILGLLLVEVGVWDLAKPMLPNERKYLGLRAEVDDFIGLVRRLNRAVLDEGSEHASVHDVRSEMHASVDRMVDLAGRSEQDAPAAVQPTR